MLGVLLRFLWLKNSGSDRFSMALMVDMSNQVEYEGMMTSCVCEARLLFGDLLGTDALLLDGCSVGLDDGRVGVGGGFGRLLDCSIGHGSIGVVGRPDGRLLAFELGGASRLGWQVAEDTAGDRLVFVLFTWNRLRAREVDGDRTNGTSSDEKLDTLAVRLGSS